MCPGRFKDALKRPQSIQKGPGRFKATQGRINASNRRIWHPGGLEPPYIYLLPQYYSIHTILCLLFTFRNHI